MTLLKPLGIVALLALAVLILPATSFAGPMTISSTTNQSGYFDYTGASTPLTGSPYNYGGQNYGGLGSIDNIAVSLTLNDGDTGPGDFDLGKLTLALDGIDTGLKLDGFTDDAIDPNQPITLSFSGSPNNAGAILAALQADGQLVGSINDATPGDNILNVTGNANTTLDITGQQVPEPATLVLLGLGVLGVAGWSMRKRLAKA